MIETLNWNNGEWVDTEYKTLKEYIKTHSHGDRPCKIRKTNQEDFDRIYLYYFDCMGHMFLIRMLEDDYRKEWYEEGLITTQKQDYEIFTDENGYRTDTPHIICGGCDRCKTCKDCICKDKHMEEN